MLKLKFYFAVNMHAAVPTNYHTTRHGMQQGDFVFATQGEEIT
jgi:hypothetical protein